MSGICRTVCNSTWAWRLVLAEGCRQGVDLDMDVKLYRWWTNVSELLRAEDWESVRHRVEARIPPIFRVLATRFLPFRLALLFMVGLAASHRLPSLSKGGKRPIVGYGPSSNNRRVLVRVMRDRK